MSSLLRASGFSNEDEHAHEEEPSNHIEESRPCRPSIHRINLSPHPLRHFSAPSCICDSRTGLLVSWEAVLPCPLQHLQVPDLSRAPTRQHFSVSNDDTVPINCTSMEINTFLHVMSTCRHIKRQLKSSCSVWILFRPAQLGKTVVTRNALRTPHPQHGVTQTLRRSHSPARLLTQATRTAGRVTRYGGSISRMTMIPVILSV